MLDFAVGAASLGPHILLMLKIIGVNPLYISGVNFPWKIKKRNVW